MIIITVAGVGVVPAHWPGSLPLLSLRLAATTLAGTEHSGARDELITRRGELWAVVTTPCLHCTGPVLVYCALYYEITAPGGYRGQL